MAVRGQGEAEWGRGSQYEGLWDGAGEGRENDGAQGRVQNASCDKGVLVPG